MLREHVAVLCFHHCFYLALQDCVQYCMRQLQGWIWCNLAIVCYTAYSSLQASALWGVVPPHEGLLAGFDYSG